LAEPKRASNLLLAALSPADAAALRPHLRPAHFEQKKILFEAGDKISQVYFPTTAVVSLVVVLSGGETVEAAMVGLDGVVGASAALNGRIALSRGIVQLEGEALVCDAGALKSAVLQSETLLSKIIRHEQTMYAQAQQSTACMAAHEIESRLCRWMLRARDLAGSDTLSFTQEFLADMLGVKRTSVTLVAKTLQRAGFIKYSRGRIQILDVEGLRESACECYESINGHYRSLLGRAAPT
jgi:CRP-like cAMP-binding protein